MLVVAAALFAPSFVIHGPAAPRVPLVLDSPHSGFAFPADFGSRLEEFDLREGEDCFVDQLYLPATERGVAPDRGARAAHLHRPQPACRRHRPRPRRRRPLAGRARAERQGAAGQGADLAHARRRPRDLRPEAAGRRGAAPDRGLPPAVPRRRARPHRGDARPLRPQLAHQLSLDERGRRRAGRRRRRARARRLRRRRSRRNDVRRRVHRVRARLASPASATTSASTIRTRASSSFAPTRIRRRDGMSLQLEINKRLYMDEATRTKSAGFEPLQRQLATLVDAVLDYTTSALRAQARRPASVAGTGAARATKTATHPAQAQRRLEDAGEHAQGRPHDALGQPVHDRRVRQRRGGGRRSTGAGCAARSLRPAASSRRRATCCAARSPAATSPAGAR